MSDFDIENQIVADAGKRNAGVWTEHNTGMDMLEGFKHDGVAALFDPSGAATRAHLRKELSSRFTILPETSGEAKDAVNDAAHMLEGTKGDTAIVNTMDGKTAQQQAQILAAYEKDTGHSLESAVGQQPGGSPVLRAGFADQSNMVTKDQYEKVVKLMADIELGRTDLVLDTLDMKTVGQRDAMRGDLADIMQTDSGRALIDSLAHRKDDHHTLINGARQKPGEARAWSVGSNDKATVSNAEYAAGKNVHHDQAELRSDVVLYHELVHSLDQLDGTLDERPIDKGDPVDVKGKLERAEYHAAGLGDSMFSRFSEGRYTGERRRIGMRNQGERTAGVADDDLMYRTRYYDLTPNPVGHYAD